MKNILDSGKRPPGRHLDSFSGPDGLRNLLRHAHFHYYRDVVLKGYNYERYRTEFINGHQFHDGEDTWEKNEHLKNIGTVAYLLKHRPLFVKRMFSSPHEQDYMNIQSTIYDPDEQDCYKCFPSSSVVQRLPKFNARLSMEMLKIIRRYVNELPHISRQYSLSKCSMCKLLFFILVIHFCRLIHIEYELIELWCVRNHIEMDFLLHTKIFQ